MEAGRRVVAQALEDLVVGPHRRARLVLSQDVRREGTRRHQPPRELRAFDHERPVVLGGQVVEQERGRGRRVPGLDPDRAPARRAQRIEVQGEAGEAVRLRAALLRADGAEEELDVGRFRVGEGARDHPADHHADRERAGAKEQPLEPDPRLAPEVAQVVVRRDRLRALVDEPQQQVVLEVLADARQVGDHRDAVLAQERGGPEAGQLQELRRLDRARAQQHLARCAHRGLRAVTPIADAHRAPPLELDAGRAGTGLDRQVGPPARGLEIRGRRRAAQAVARRQLEVAGAVLPRAVEVVGARNAELAGGGDQGLDERVPPGDVGDRERPVAAVVLARAAGVRLRLDEVAQGLARVPAVGAERLPAVEILRLPADLDQPVDRARAAERAAARRVDLAAVQVRLRLGVEPPVEHRVEHRLAVADRDVDPRVAVRRPRFQQQGGALPVRGQPVGEDAARRAAADDHVVEGPLRAAAIDSVRSHPITLYQVPRAWPRCGTASDHAGGTPHVGGGVHEAGS